MSSIVSGKEDSLILRNQFRSDIQMMVSEVAPKPSEQIDALSEQLITKIKSEYPNRFLLTKEERGRLSKNQQIISKAVFTNSIKELKKIATNPGLPKMLAWYLDYDSKVGLNPAQRLLAFRLIESLHKKMALQVNLWVNSGSGKSPSV